MAVTDTRGDEAEALVWSACSAMAETALTLLRRNPKLSRYDLSTAAVCGESEIIAKLMEADRARANMFFTPLGRTPLHYATFSRLGRTDAGRADRLRETVRVLLEAGADPNIVFTHDGWVQAPIYGAAGIAGDPEMTKLLLDAGADPNDTGPDRQVGEALYHATEMADPACARLLIQAGTNITAIRHCLGRALDFDNPAMVRMYCEEGAQVTAAHLHHAVWHRRGRSTVEALIGNGAPLDVPDEHGLTALQIARRWGDADVVALLCDHGAGDGDDPPLSTEQEQAVTDAMVITAVERGSLDDVRRLLEAGARVDGDGSSSVRTPIGQACWRGRVEVVAELLARGALTEFTDGGSALGAARHGSGHCNDPEGGPTMATVEEIDQRPYRRIEELLAER